MKRMSEEQAGGYIGSLIERNSALKKAVNRHFQGTIVHVDAPDGNWPFTVNIDRTEGPDGMDWICAIPGYVPRIGDEVECEWRDEDTGYIKYPLTHHKLTATVALAGTFSIGTSPTAINWDTLVRDPYKCFDTGLTGFTAPYSGIYRANGSYRVTTAGEMIVYFYINGTVYRSPILSSTTGAFAVGGTAQIPLLAGDFLQMYAQQPTGAQNAGSNAQVANFFDVEYMGPL